jgi:hypothetical protein
VAHTEQYRNNRIEVRERDDGSEELLINDEVVEAAPDPSVPGMLSSRYSFSPAPTLQELGQLIVDAQLALTEPKLKSLKK